MINLNPLELSLPVLQKTGQGNGISWHPNSYFLETFPDFNNHQSSTFKHLSQFFEKIDKNNKLHWKGIIYLIDHIVVGKKESYYLLSASNDSVSQSFLWLKHDLLNILNPIMGFSDIMATEEHIGEENRLILQKIHKNSQKMFLQFQRIAQLQNINKQKEFVYNGYYSLKSFLNELVDKLMVDDVLTSDVDISMPQDFLIPDFITLHQFRSVFEDQLSYFCKQQEHAQMTISMLMEEPGNCICFHFPKCSMSPQNLDHFLQVEAFVSSSSSLQKLQIQSLNYLLFNELIKIAGGSSKITYSKEQLIFKVFLPLTESKEKISKNPLSKHPENSQATLILKVDEYPEELLKELKEVWKNFDGLMILDQWESLTQKMIHINKKYNNKELEERIENISAAIKSFDVDTLRGIYSRCSSFLKESES